MATVADANGNLTGTFTIPAGIPSGTKLVEFYGKGGSYGHATYIGESSIVTNYYETVYTYTTHLIDPLAETFTLTETATVVGFDLFVASLSASAPLIVQVRDVQNGLPGSVIYGQGRAYAASMASSIQSTAGSISISSLVAGQMNTIMLDVPVVLQGGTTYALVVQSDDSAYSVGVAKLGGFDASQQKWVTSQPYSVGVMLTSSNAQTWTPSQDTDLTFAVRVSSFVPGSSTIDLGKVTVAGATDLILLPVAFVPDPSLEPKYTLTMPSGQTMNVLNGQAVSLPSAVTGDIDVKVSLPSSSTLSSRLDPGTVLVAGAVASTANYVSRAVPGSANTTLTVIYDAYVPSGSSVTAQYQIVGTSTWTNIPVAGTVPADGGAMEFTCTATGLNATAGVRVQLLLAGTSAARPLCADLRIIVT